MTFSVYMRYCKVCGKVFKCYSKTCDKCYQHAKGCQKKYSYPESEWDENDRKPRLFPR